MRVRDSVHGVVVRSPGTWFWLAGFLCLTWVWYGSLRHADIATITRQQPGIAMSYYAGTAEGGVVAGRSGMTGAIGGFRLGVPGWSFDAKRSAYPAKDGAFAAPVLYLRHPENGGFPEKPGARNHFSYLLIPMWLILAVYLSAWAGFAFSKRRRRHALQAG